MNLKLYCKYFSRGPFIVLNVFIRQPLFEGEGRNPLPPQLSDKLLNVTPTIIQIA